MMKNSVKSLEGIAIIICMMLAVILAASCAKEETNREAKYTQAVPAEYTGQETEDIICLS